MSVTSGLVIYDYAITLSAELTYIWTRPLTVGKIVFLLIRYATLAKVILSICGQWTVRLLVSYSALFEID